MNVLSSLVRPIRSIVAAPLRLLTRAEEPEAADIAANAARAAVAPRRSGKYEAPLINAVRARPGITVAEAAASLEVPATALYPTIRRLQAENRLIKHGRGLRSA